MPKILKIPNIANVVNTVNTDNAVILNYERGKFILSNVGDKKLKARLSLDDAWGNTGNDSYTTTDLGAASKFRTAAAERVRNLLRERLQTFYAPPPTTEFPEGLDENQVQGIFWALTRKRSYLAHAPGAGKTAQAIIAACFAAGKGRTLFIVPPSLTKNWEREILKFTDWLDLWPAIGIIPRSDKKDEAAWRADFIVCPDSMLAKPWVAEKLRSIDWKFIAVDEASRLKDPFAQRSLAFYGGRDEKNHFTPLYRGARHVVFLDGSPMPNRPMELWAPVFALSPETIDFMSLDAFGYRYCGARPNEHGQWEYLFSSNEDELRGKLRKDFMHVVTEDELFHPERRRSIFTLAHDVRSREHKTWERKSITSLTEMFEGGVGEDASRGDFARFRRELGLRKAPYVAEYVRERLEEKNESILLFAWHRDVVHQLAIELDRFKPGVVLGGTPAFAREKIFERFQAGKSRLLIMNIAAAGRGHNLQRADRVIFAEFSWTDETNKQAEKRASRKGSTKRFVRCEYMVAPGSMDEIVLTSVFSKERRVKKVIG